MKNAKKIKNNLTSLFLAFTMILGSVAFAVPGSMPSAAAATENLFVSADNILFDKSFNGPMIIEVVVNDDDLDDLNNGPEPDVTVNGGNLKMVQAGDGNWYAYIADKQILTTAHNTINYGTPKPVSTSGLGFDQFDSTTTDAGILYVNADDVIRQPKAVNTGNSIANSGIDRIWPVIQAFEFSVDGSVTVSYAKGGNPQSVSITYLDDPDDYASLSLDRTTYPAGADVHLTITSLAHNIDPTDEDSWTYNTNSTNGTGVYYHLFNENGNKGTNNVSFTTEFLETIKFDDSAVLKIDVNPNDARVDILEFVDNEHQGDSIVSQQVTILETQPNSGIFKNTDKGDIANIKINPVAQRGYTATIDFADNPISIPIRNYPGSLTMDVDGIGGTWNGGEEITVTLDDGDLNLNSLRDQDIEISNWDQKIPTVIIGTPLTLKDATLWTAGTTTFTTVDNRSGTPTTTIVRSAENVQYNSANFEIESFSKRMLIEKNTDYNVTRSINATHWEVDIYDVDETTAGIVGADYNVASSYFDFADYFYYVNNYDNESNTTSLNSFSTIEFITYDATNPLVTITGNSSIVINDIFSFGQSASELESAATTRNANAIYRILLEETGDNTALYIGTIEYTALNQLNVRDLDTYNRLATIDDEITIIVPTDLTDEDAVRVDYLDVDGEGISTQIGDQIDAPTHSGVVSFDAANYKVADTVTVTLTDADLNTNSDTTEVYTSISDSLGDRVGKASDGSNSQVGRLVDITFDDATWTSYTCDLDNDANTVDTKDGLSTTGFILSETTATSGIFIGTFQIPQNYCTNNGETSTTTGKDLEVNYVDYSEASGELIEVGDSAGIRANTGSVSFERTVYPVPFNPTEYITQNRSNTLAMEDPSITGNTVLHIRINDPDYDISGSGSDTLPANTVTVKILRGSLSSSNLATDNVAIKEISPDAGIFELDLSLSDKFWCGENTDCEFTQNTFVKIRQGDIITAEYTDATDASGNKNTVTDSATFDLRNAVLQTDKDAYIIGGDMILTLIEPDFNLDSDETESYPLNLIEWDSDAGILALGESTNFDPEPSALRETGDNTGIFQVVIEVPEKLPDNLGEALERGEQIDLEYIDYGPAGADSVGDDDEDIELTVFTSNFGATIALDQKVYSWTDKVFITITAPDHNFDSDLIDQIGDTSDDPIKISTRENNIGYYRLVESGTDTGIFTGEVILTGFRHDADGKIGFDAPTQDTTSYDTRNNPAGPTDGYLEAEDDDGITVSFEVSEDETVIGSAIIRWNIGEVEWAEASYPASGNGLVRITDPDLNLNPESVDNFDVDVWSDSDPGGISLTVTETNEATGVFEGKVSFTTNDESSGHRLRVAEGDTITAEYEDHTLPDPYDTSDDLDILSTAIIGSIVAPLERAPVSNARIVDTQGQTLSTVSVDQQVLVSADLRSGQDKDQDYAYLVQIQDADGVTVSLSWITSTLTAGSASSPSQSWTPTVSGDYTATVFVWESITNPTALSPSDTVTIQVS